MMTNFRSQHSRGLLRRLLANRVSVAVIIVFLIVAVFSFAGNSIVNSLLKSAAAPFWQWRAAVVDDVIASWYLLFVREKTLIVENKLLRERISNLERSDVIKTALQNELADIKSQLGRTQSYAPVLAAVLARPPVSLYDTLIIDAGRRDGIEVGDLAVAFGDYVIGQVTESQTAMATVRLFSAPGVSSRVHIGENYIPAEAVGKGGGTFEVKLPRSISIQKGDEVIFPDINTLVFAVVEDIFANPSDPFQTILFRSPVNIQTIRFVTILTNTPPGALEVEAGNLKEQPLHTPSSAATTSEEESDYQ